MSIDFMQCFWTIDQYMIDSDPHYIAIPLVEVVDLLRPAHETVLQCKPD
jgi:hypothetical protein